MKKSNDDIKQIAQDLLSGRLTTDAFAEAVSGWCNPHPGIADVGAAQVDLDRQRRCGFPEVVYAEGKTVEAMADIFRSLIGNHHDVLATRMEAAKAEQLLDIFPQASYNPVGRTFRIAVSDVGPDPSDATICKIKGKVAVVSAGTSDLPVAEEARETALWTGAEVTLVQDIGVAGPHRLQANLPRLRDADAVVVIAGMEGALPSVVGGYVAVPVIAVPTSVGYGASFGGLAALLGMLNSCASNVTVVNIDAGFKGGYLAGLIAKNVAMARSHN